MLVWRRISLNDLRLFKVYNYEIKDKLENKIDGKEYIFTAKFEGKISEIKLDEGAGFAFFDSAEIDSLKLAETNIRILKDYLYSKSGFI